jgi:16S rRNA (cytidine1402-2'-O)-methyltransferase
LPTGNLYLVPVPVGNLGDITLRALETLKKADLIAAEDTRKTRFLLTHFEIKPRRLLSLHKYNEKQRQAEILALLEEGKDIAVVSDAGSPGISDPAMILVQAVIARGINIVPLPGATALVPALTASGLDTGAFLFLGFPPLKAKNRKALWELIRNSRVTVVLYEAPHRLRETLADLYGHCGDRPVCIAREISKLHEEFIRGSLGEILNPYEVTEKGEFVIIIGAAHAEQAPPEEEIEAFIRDRLSQGAGCREVAEEAAQSFGINRNQAYSMALRCKGGIA